VDKHLRTNRGQIYNYDLALKNYFNIIFEIISNKYKKVHLMGVYVRKKKIYIVSEYSE